MAWQVICMKMYVKKFESRYKVNHVVKWYMCKKPFQLAIMTTEGAEILKNMQGSVGMVVPQLTETHTNMHMVRMYSINLSIENAEWWSEILFIYLFIV